MYKLAAYIFSVNMYLVQYKESTLKEEIYMYLIESTLKEEIYMYLIQYKESILKEEIYMYLIQYKESILKEEIYMYLIQYKESTLKEEIASISHRKSLLLAIYMLTDLKLKIAFTIQSTFQR